MINTHLHIGYSLSLRSSIETAIKDVGWEDDGRKLC